MRFLPGPRRWFAQLSGVTHGMVFDRVVIVDLIDKVQCHWGMPFWQAFLAAVSPRWRAHGGASEYDLYFYFALQFHSERVRARSLAWCVSGDVIHAACLNRKFQYITVHRH